VISGGATSGNSLRNAVLHAARLLLKIVASILVLIASFGCLAYVYCSS
jgi:hypothetical protein